MNGQKEIIAMNITNYKNFDDFAKHNGYYTREEFENEMQDGWFADMTCGTYNGATNTFTPWQLTENNNINAILNYIHECELYEYISECTESESELEPIEYVRSFTEIYDVFTFEGKIYADLN